MTLIDLIIVVFLHRYRIIFFEGVKKKNENKMERKVSIRSCNAITRNILMTA